MTGDTIKFLIIALCFVIAMASYCFCHSRRDWAYLVAAMGFTLASDYFLVLAHMERQGVFVFCFVHIIYITRVSQKKSQVSVASIVCLAALAFFILPADPLILLSLTYASLFALNLKAHILYYRRGALPMTNRRLMLAGLILFALCDIHVLLHNLPRFLAIPPELSHWGRTWIWIFYVPSQLLLSLSAISWRAKVKTVGALPPLPPQTFEKV